MKRILVTGAKGMLGRQVVNQLKLRGFHVIEHERSLANLLDTEQTKIFFRKSNPDTVVHCAAVVGGIKANMNGGLKYFYENLELDNNVFSAAFDSKVKRLLYIASSCMYPANKSHKLEVEEIGLEPLEPTNRYYAMAKIQGTRKVKDYVARCKLDWRVIVASNLYGPNDNFDLDTSHLIAAVIAKVKLAIKLGASEVEMWGDGSARREFTYSPELASWISENLENIHSFPDVMNVGFGVDYSVKEYYEMVLNLMGKSLKIVARPDLPSGNLKKLMNSSTAGKFGWNPKISPFEGIPKTLEWVEKNGVFCD